MNSNKFQSYLIKPTIFWLLLVFISSPLSAPSISRYDLIDAHDNRTIKEVDEGTFVDLGGDSYILNIKAIANIETQSVVFFLDGALARVEYDRPFSLAGDVDGDYLPWTPSLGYHEIRAVPYSGLYPDGEEGEEYIRNFNVGIVYTPINLGSNSSFYCLNDYGVIAGYSSTTGDDHNIVVWEDSTRTLIIPTSDIISHPFGINNMNSVVGGSADPMKPWIWKNHRLTRIPASPADAYNGARAINNQGQAVVQTEDSIYIYENGSLTPIESVFRNPADINDNGQIVGPGKLPRGFQGQAYIYEDGVLTPIGTMGGTNSNAEAVNDHGVVTGYSQLEGDGEGHAFTWHNGVFTDLGPFGDCYGQDINNAGWVVGCDDIPETEHKKPVVHDGRTLLDLSQLCPGLPINEFPRAINNSGMILTQNHLLVPVGLLRVARFVLIDAAQDDIIKEIEPGETIDLSEVGHALNIRADVEGMAGSVQFELNGSVFQTENIAPYALAGNNIYDYHIWSPATGDYSITATPYTQDHASGDSGKSASISFQIIETTSPSVNLGPQWSQIPISINSEAEAVLNQFPDGWNDGWQPSVIILGIRGDDGQTLNGISVSVNGNEHQLNDWWYEISLPYNGPNPITYNFSSPTSRRIVATWWGE